MYRIYFDKRTLFICNKNETPSPDTNSVNYFPSYDKGVSDIATFFDNNKNIHNLYIRTDNDDRFYKQICSSFQQINAGGGLIINEKGEYLLIHRNNIWDLPKGKQEPNEDIRETALREVTEESGVNNHEIKELICITDHTYHRDSQFILKHTYWYKMTCTSDIVLKPQTEEDIDEVKWVSPCDIDIYLQNSYPSIIDVFSKLS